jgi:PAS domain S-box-containing protein
MLGTPVDKLMTLRTSIKLHSMVVLPLAVLLLGMALSAAGAWWFAGQVQAKAQADFQRATERLSSELLRRFQLPIYGLKGARGMYAASSSIQRNEFKAYVDSRDLHAEFPGVRGLGFIQRLQRAEVAGFEAEQRADDAPQFAVKQLEDTLHDDLYIIKFIEPMANNAPAVGLDVGSEAVRRAGLMQAVDSGQPAISGAISLVQNASKTPGVLLYVPLYAKGAVLTSVAQRRAALVGLLYAPIVIVELLQEIPDVLAGELDFELFDASAGESAGALIFDADNPLAVTGAAAKPIGEPLFQRNISLALPGRTMTAQISSTPLFDRTVERWSAWLVLLGGSLLSAFLALLLRQQAGARGRAEALARDMTVDLERLAIVVRKTSNAVIITNVERQITWVNSGFERITGFSAAEAIGCLPGKLLQSAATDAATIAQMRAALDSGQGFTGELLNRKKNGEDFLIEIEIQPLQDEFGTLNGYMSIESDITVRHAAQQQLESVLRDNAALLSTLNQHAIISVADREGNITEVNQAFCRTSGYGREELLGKSHRLINSGLHSAEFWMNMWKTISQGESWRAVICNRAKNGSLYWVDTTVAPFLDNDGRVEKYISIRIDVTAAKEQETSLRIARDQLERAADVAEMGIWTWNPDDDSLLFDSRMRSIYEMAEAVDGGLCYAYWRSRVHPDDIGFTEAKLQGALAGTDVYDPVFRIFSRSGKVRYIQAACTVERDGAGKALLVMGINRDITAQYETEAVLRAAKSSADAASRAKSEFLANMSHELRTPMNAILGMLTLLGKTGLSSKQADYAAKSEGAARSLLGLLNQILDFSKIEVGKMALDLQPIAIDKLLRELSIILSSNLKSKHVELLFDIDPQLPRLLYGDGMRLQQVLVNLGGNAVKFTEHGEVRLSIKVLQQSASQVSLQFAVSDTGIGIAPENQALIFNGFSQAEASITRRFGGTGLGVSISQSLLALMGGELKIESTLGQGSRFYFELVLPVLVDAAESAVGPGRQAKLRALVVDDSPSVRELLQNMGRSLGWDMDVVDSGEAALQLLQRQIHAGTSYGAIFVDWQMPGLDGWQTSQKIRQMLPAGQGPLIVMVTANQREMLLQRTPAEQALLDGFLVKPVTASMLFDAVVEAQAKSSAPKISIGVANLASQRLLGMRLLLVEDNLNNQQIARELLESEGAIVHIANHGQEALDALVTSPAGFDLLLMDLQMPVMDGFTATRHIREDMGLHDLPIVAMTANAMQSDRDACFAAGMNEHVGKPFNFNNLVDVVRTQLGKTPLPAPVATAAVVAPIVESALPTSVSEAAALAEIDLVRALQFMAGQQDLYERLLPMFLDSLLAMPEQLRGHVAQGETLAASRLLHSLKGLAAQMGATGLSQQAAQGEKLLAGNPSAEQASAALEQACKVIISAQPGLLALQQAFAAQQISAVAAGTPEPVNVPALNAALRNLAQLLKASDMQALACMSALQAQYSAALAEQLDPLCSAVQNLDFTQAEQLCAVLLEVYKL